MVLSEEHTEGALLQIEYPPRGGEETMRKEIILVNTGKMSEN